MYTCIENYKSSSGREVLELVSIESEQLTRTFEVLVLINTFIHDYMYDI